MVRGIRSRERISHSHTIETLFSGCFTSTSKSIEYTFINIYCWCEKSLVIDGPQFIISVETDS